MSLWLEDCPMSADAWMLPVADRMGLREGIRDFLRQSGAVSVAGMARFLDTDAVTVRAELEHLVAGGQVEMLKPIAATPSERADDLDYCRWIRPTDDDYAWQTLLLRPLEHRPLRLSDANLALFVD